MLLCSFPCPSLFLWVWPLSTSSHCPEQSHLQPLCSKMCTLSPGLDPISCRKEADRVHKATRWGRFRPLADGLSCIYSQCWKMPKTLCWRVNQMAKALPRGFSIYNVKYTKGMLGAVSWLLNNQRKINQLGKVYLCGNGEENCCHQWEVSSSTGYWLKQ